eukprot:12417746-Karenia_brevis.AAC.1
MPHSDKDARTAFALLNGAGVVRDVPDLPHEVMGEPSREPDAFSDGSFSDARHPDFSLTSAGIWWPNRQLNDSPLT